MRTGKKVTSLYAILSLLIILYAGCKKEEPVTPGNTITKAEKSINSCEGCHTNYEVLKAIAAPDTAAPAESHGCGGEPPHYEPYDRVYLGGDGYSAFQNTMHGKLACTDCHNGVDNTDDKSLAHSGDFISHPSSNAKEKCANCHPDAVSRAANSLHEQGWGQKSMVALRSGVNSFDEIPEVMKAGYNSNCATCHASCGDCHVVRPKAGGGGLSGGHLFSKPDMRDNCTICHVSRGGHAYFGVAPGTVADVHLTKAQFECMNCHSEDEVHGDGNIYNQRYKMALLPKCTNCHTDINNSNMYHVQHINSFNCNTCHSQDYNNCGSCHIGGEGARIPSYQGFKIGINPIPETKPYKFATLRRSLMAPDSWQNYGTPVLANFDVRPTYKYTTPHNITRWTSRTKVEAGKACYDACHIIKEGDNYRNKELYLFKSDLMDWETSADKNIIVDGKLPSKWGINQ